MDSMRNYRKHLSASGISIIASMMAQSVLNLFTAGELSDRPMAPIDPFRIGRMPGWAMTPVHKHGCNKRGGRSKRRRGLNYWRH